MSAVLGTDACGLESILLTLVISDAFAGGFIAGIVEGKSLDESIDMGHWLASLSIKELGPQYVQPLLTTLFIVLAIITKRQHAKSTQTQHSFPFSLQ